MTEKVTIVEEELEAPPKVEFDVSDDELDDDEGDEGDDDGDDGWVAFYVDGEQQGFDHPEGKTHEEFLEEIEGAINKGRQTFSWDRNMIRLDLLRSFCWSEGTTFPETDKFDGLQMRVEHLLQASAHVVDGCQQVTHAISFLSNQQAELQQAQAQLFKVEIEDQQAEAAAAAAAASRPRKPVGALKINKPRG